MMGKKAQPFASMVMFMKRINIWKESGCYCWNNTITKEHTAKNYTGTKRDGRLLCMQLGTALRQGNTHFSRNTELPHSTETTSWMGG